MSWIMPAAPRGSVTPPGSKSETQRAVLLAAVADGPSTIRNANLGTDGEASTRVAQALGAAVTRVGTTLTVEPRRRPRAATVDVGESATALRLGAVLATLSDEALTFAPQGTLRTRDQAPLVAALEAFGARATRLADGSWRVAGPLRPGCATVDGSAGSQPISGLLLALPLLDGPSTLVVENPASLPYLRLTLAVAESFGIGVEGVPVGRTMRYTVPVGPRPHGTAYAVEPDWSSAAFWLVAGATTGSVTIPGLRPDSLQPDAAVLGPLHSAGARITLTPGGMRTVQSELRAFRYDATQTPDAVPPLVALAAACDGVSRIGGVHRLRGKESDRARALVDLCTTLGIDARVDGDEIVVAGGVPGAGVVDSHADHRIAMTAAVVALRATGPVEILDPGCVAKSYPGFFDDLERITR